MEGGWVVWRREGSVDGGWVAWREGSVEWQALHHTDTMPTNITSSQNTHFSSKSSGFTLE